MKRRFRPLIAITALAVALPSPAAAQFDIGGIVRKARAAKNVVNSLRDIGEAEEISLGANLAGIILGAAPLTQDRAQQHYVNRLGEWLAMHSERPTLPWKFGVFDSDDFNAFSTPGGHVLISRGLFERMRNESELAGVLAHEIAHVVKKHHLGALQKGMGTAALSDIGQITGAARVGGGITGAITERLIEGGKQMFISGLDKDDEYEADRMGVVIAARSGYSPYGLVGVLQTLSAEPVDGRTRLMSRTHPLPLDRIERLGGSMGTKLDTVAGLVDDLPSFTALRNPVAAKATPAALQPRTTTPARRRPRRN